MARPPFTISFTGVAMCLCALGACSPYHRDPPVDLIDTPGLVSLVEALDMANTLATSELARFNQMVNWPNQALGETALKLDEYDKTMNQEWAKHWRIFVFSYDCRRSVQAEGFPAHFSVAINRHTRGASLRHGR